MEFKRMVKMEFKRMGLSNIMVLCLWLFFSISLEAKDKIGNEIQYNNEIEFQGIEISFSEDDAKIVYADGKSAYLVPLDANKKRFANLKYYTKTGNIFTALYYSSTNGTVAYSYMIDKNTGYIKVGTSSYDCYIQLQLKADALVIPDQVTNDELFWLGKGHDKLRIPGDNHLFIELLDNGNAMLNCLWDFPEQEIIANFDEITFNCSPGGNIWFGFLAKKNIWYRTNFELNDKALPVEWVPPFNATWHMVFQRDKGRIPIEDGTGDMWVLVDKDGKDLTYDGIRITSRDPMQAWGTGIGKIGYPCYVDKDKTFLSLPQFHYSMKRINYNNKAKVIYPFSSSENTPRDILLASDAVNKFTGKQSRMIRSVRPMLLPTCGSTARIEKIFSRGADEVKKKKDEIRKKLERMDVFVYVINTQLKENLRFAKSLQNWLADKKKHHPELTEQIDKYINELEEIEKYYIAKKDQIKTPADCMILSKGLVDLIDADLDEEEKEERSKLLGREIRTVGGAQDTTSALQRMHLKAIKQQVTISLVKATDKEMVEFLQQFRQKLHQKLRINGMFEGK
ncbi:MAG: hypothetical protein PHG64_13260 [Paludibacter sp.]|nr:hypothetical protein [Paludibacter sp.]